MITDPLFPHQWQLHPSSPWNVKAYRVWPDYTGKGVSVLVVDDGFQTDHPDLEANIISQIDLESMTPDARPVSDTENHGTSVAGLIAAPINGLGGVGVAPEASLALARLLFDGDEPDDEPPPGEATAFALALEHDVMSNSWGYGPFGDSMLFPAFAEHYTNLETAVRDGRKGLGTVIVFSAGNEDGSYYSSNFKNLQNNPFVIAVGNLAQDGAIDETSLPGANVLIAAPGDGTLTTDRLPPHGYEPEDAYTFFGGTSAAAPVVSGVVALMLEANPNLGYRDVQEILAYSARETPFMQADTNCAGNWNMGGLTFSDSFGFGVVDALAAVRLAETWHKQSTQQNLIEWRDVAIDLTDRPLGSTLEYTFKVSNPFILEHVQLAVDIQGVSLEHLRIDLVSPAGTRSTLVKDALLETDGLEFIFSSVQFFGENSTGTWHLEITNTGSEGVIREIGFTALGGNDSRVHIITDAVLGMDGPLVMNTDGYTGINAAAFSGDSLINLGSLASFTFGFQNGSITDPGVIQTVSTGDGNDIIVVNSLDNIIHAGRGNDLISSGLGSNTIMAGSGLDIVEYSEYSFEQLVVTGNSAQAQVRSQDFVDTLYDTTLLLSGENAVIMLAPTSGIVAGFLDPDFYLDVNQDVALAGMDPLEHYINYGQFENRAPNPLLDPAYYLERYPDVAHAVEQGWMTAHSHYAQWGWTEGRDPSSYFSTHTYLDVNQDVALAGMNPLDHYLLYGFAEGRTAFMA